MYTQKMCSFSCKNRIPPRTSVPWCLPTCSSENVGLTSWKITVGLFEALDCLMFDSHYQNHISYALYCPPQHPVERERNGIITGYTIRYWANITRDPAIPLFKFEVKLRTNATTLTLTELTPETEYFVEVAANTTVGMGPYSDFVTGSTLIS